MIFFACHTKGCANYGAPYHDADDDAEPFDCPICGKPMKAIPEPDPLIPPEPAPDNTPEEQLGFARAQAQARARAALAATDVWAARHVEDGYSLTADRIAYRAELRGLLAEIATSDDPESLPLPDEPPPPDATEPRPLPTGARVAAAAAASVSSVLPIAAPTSTADQRSQASSAAEAAARDALDE